MQSAPPPTIAPVQALADVFQDVSNIYEPANEETPKVAPEMLGPTLEEATMSPLETAEEYGVFEQFMALPDVELESAEELHGLLSMEQPYARVVTIDADYQHWIEVIYLLLSFSF